MTVIGRDCYSEDMAGDHRYRPSACPRCGAKTVDEAGTMCRPSPMSDTGDYWCPGDEPHNPFGIRWDTKGRACQLTNESAKREARMLKEWCEGQAQEMLSP